MHVGDVLTYKVLTKQHKVIFRSAIRTAMNPTNRNRRVSTTEGEMSSNNTGEKIFIFSHLNLQISDDGLCDRKTKMITIDPKELIGRTFLKETEEDGQRFQARVVWAIIDKEKQQDPQYTKFLCEVDGDVADKILTYNEILDHIERESNDLENDTEQVYKFREISAHQGPLRASDKDYKGSLYNILVEWETGETTYEPLDLIAEDDPVSCAEYARRNRLLDTPGWKRFKRLGQSEKKIKRIVNQAKLQSYRCDPFWKFGVLVPRTHVQAVKIDRKNGNTKWQDSEKTEM
jgi:hypothetical protein